MAPYTVPNVIAYRQEAAKPSLPIPKCGAGPENLFKAYSIVQNYLQNTGFLKDQVPKIVLPTKRTSKQEDAESQVEIDCMPQPPDISQNPPFLVGEEAYNLSPDQPYEKHFPILRGHFNVNKTQSWWTVVNDLERILEYSATRILKIPRDMFSQFSVVLLVPDAFFKEQVKTTVNILLKFLGFRSIFLIQESISAIFGAGVPSACVVDIGAAHMNVVCVEEGIILPKTHVRQLYAGSDIDLLLLRVIEKLSTEEKNQLRVVEAIKKNACRFVQEENAVTYNCKHLEGAFKLSSSSPALVISCHSLFHASLLEISSGAPEVPLTLHPAFAYDTDDYLEDLIETKVESVPHPTIEKTLSLDQMIIRSITLIEQPETRKKMANCILLTGGGGKFPDLLDILEDRLINRFPEDTNIERVEVKSSVTHSDSEGNKETIPADHVKWVGGTVLPFLESAKELWISRSRWVGEWHPAEAKEELMANFVSFENPYQLAERCRKWRRDRPLEGGVRHIKEKSIFTW